MTLAPYVAILGRGPGRSRSLTQDEAQEAMTAMLADGAAPEAVGALLMLLRMKGETAEEIAGLARAAQSALPDFPPVDLDWPSYAAGRTRGLPWFLLSALLVAQAGHRVLLHGWNGADPSVRDGVRQLAIPMGRAGLARGIAYVPLECLSPALFRLLTLRDVLGLRSCVNTVCRMLNPGQARASVQGVFHPSYRLLQSDAAGLMGWEALSVIKGGGGEFERHPGRTTALFGRRARHPVDRSDPQLIDDQRRLSDGPQDPALLTALWAGTWYDPFAEATVIGTAALALDTLGEAAPLDQARALWADRPQARAA